MPFLRKSLAKAYCNSISTKTSNSNEKRPDRAETKNGSRDVRECPYEDRESDPFWRLFGFVSKWLVGEGVWRGWDFE